MKRSLISHTCNRINCTFLNGLNIVVAGSLWFLPYTHVWRKVDYIDACNTVHCGHVQTAVGHKYTCVQSVSGYTYISPSAVPGWFASAISGQSRFPLNIRRSHNCIAFHSIWYVFYQPIDQLSSGPALNWFVRDRRLDFQSSAPTYAPHILRCPVNAARPCMTRQLSITASQNCNWFEILKNSPTTVPGVSLTQYSASLLVATCSNRRAAVYHWRTSSGVQPSPKTHLSSLFHRA